MGVYIKGLSIEQVKTLLDCAGGDGLGEAFETYLVEVPEPHGDLIDKTEIMYKWEDNRLLIIAPTVIKAEGK